MKIKEVIIVEGKSDTVKVKQAVEADTIETNGLDINRNLLEQIRHAKKKRGVIIFTDPDFAGEKIRKTIDQAIPGCKHAFLPKDKAKGRRSGTLNIGIEHASCKDIQEALAIVYEKKESSQVEITQKDLFHNQLIGAKGSKRRREILGRVLKIGEPNAKQLLKRLQMFHIEKDEFIQAMKIVRKEEQNEP